MEPRKGETDRESILRLLRDLSCEPKEEESGEIRFSCRGLALAVVLVEGRGVLFTTLRQGREVGMSDDAGAEYYVHRRSLLGCVARFNDLPGRMVRAGVHRGDKRCVTVGMEFDPRSFDEHFDRNCQMLLDAKREIEEAYRDLVVENS